MALKNKMPVSPGLLPPLEQKEIMGENLVSKYNNMRRILEELWRYAYTGFREMSQVGLYTAIQRGQITAVGASTFVCTLVDDADTPTVAVTPVTHYGSNALSGNVIPSLAIGDHIAVFKNSSGNYYTDIIFRDWEFVPG